MAEDFDLAEYRRWLDDMLNRVSELGRQIAEEGPEIVAGAERFNLYGDESVGGQS